MEWIWYGVCVLLGFFLCLVAQVAFFIWYIRETPPGNPIPDGPPPHYRLPESVEHLGLYSDSGDCAAALSLTLQFLFQELKHAPAPLSWLHRKLQQELVDLLTRTTSGKFFESLTIRSISTGNSAPCIRWAGVQNVETNKEGRIKTLDLLLDVYYSGGFRLAVDAGMLLGKSACFDVEVEQLSGRARIRFTVDPFTHWSLSFISPPQLDLCTRSLRGRFATLLQAHARRALQKRHTLPNYTLRFKPFFTKIDPSQLEPTSEDYQFKPQGNFEITLYEITRLYTGSWTCKENCFVYCSISLDSNSWISYRQESECSIFTLDIVVQKERSQQLGTIFKQVNAAGSGKNKTQVVIETVVPLSAAYRADLRRDDIIVAVDNKMITSMSQIGKIIKNINRPCFTIRIERKIKKNSGGEGTFGSGEKHRSKSIEQTDFSTLKPEKSNSFSFRKMSDVIDSAKSVGQEGRALLRNAHSNWNMQDLDKKNDGESADQKTSSAKSQQLKSDPPSKPSDIIQPSFGFGLRKRRCSVENRTSSDSSSSSTPTASIPGTPSKRQDKSFNDRNKPPSEDSYSSQSKQETCLPNINISDSNLTEKQDDSFEIVKDYDENVSNLFQFQKFPLLPLDDMVICNETVSFKFNKNNRFLNLNVWGKNPNSSEEILLGYLNVSLSNILKDCSKSKIGQSVKKFNLLPPEVDPSVSKTHPLASHSGFEPCLCYGDVLLSFTWQNGGSQLGSEKNSDSIDLERNTKESEIELLEDLSDSAKTNGDSNFKSGSSDNEVPWKSHNFIRTHFHRSTQCDFCRKKIWLKDAVQCQDCALCCHKKCVTKCLSSERCQPPNVNYPDDPVVQSQEVSGSATQMPEFLMTEHLDDSDNAGNENVPKTGETATKPNESLLTRSTLTGLLGGLRRVGSANSLTPSIHSPSSTKSLPPSPQHALRSKTQEDSAVWLLVDTSIEKGITDIEELIQCLLVAQLSSDFLLATARDYGPQLLAGLPSDVRSEKISSLISDIKTALDGESKKLQSLNVSSNKMSCSQTYLTGDAEERAQILTALLLHCCSAMQSVNKDAF